MSLTPQGPTPAPRSGCWTRTTQLRTERAKWALLLGYTFRTRRRLGVCPQAPGWDLLSSSSGRSCHGRHVPRSGGCQLPLAQPLAPAPERRAGPASRSDCLAVSGFQGLVHTCQRQSRPLGRPEPPCWASQGRRGGGHPAARGRSRWQSRDAGPGASALGPSAVAPGPVLSCPCQAGHTRPHTAVPGAWAATRGAAPSGAGAS